MEEFTACFGDIEGSRDSNARHPLLELLMIGLCTMLWGGEECSDMASFGRRKESPSRFHHPALLCPVDIELIVLGVTIRRRETRHRLDPMASAGRKR